MDFKEHPEYPRYVISKSGEYMTAFVENTLTYLLILMDTILAV